MKTLRVSAAQYPITRFESWAAWQQNLETWVAQASEDGAQVLMFPEYGAMELVGLLPDDKQMDLKEQVQEIGKVRGDFIGIFQREARRHGVAILAPSLPVVEDGFASPVNRAYFFTPDGEVGFQDKMHMTRFEDEDWGVGPGVPELKVFEVFGARIGVNICFDVELPFAAHQLARRGVHLLLVPSCTETMKGMNRVHVGARARALENQFYVAVSHTVGDAPWSQAVDFNTGQAAFYSTCDLGFPDDGVLAKGELNRPQWLHYELDLALIEDVRDRGEVFNYRQMLQHQ